MYTLFRFGEIVLPDYEKIQDLDSAVLHDSTARTISGAYRVAGTGRRPQAFPFSQTLECTVHESALAIMRASIDSMRGLAGQYDRLYRRADDNGEVHWCYADVLQFRHRRVPNRKWWHDIKLDFELWSPWYGIPHDGFYLNDDEYLNDGEYVNDAAINEVLASSQHTVNINNAGNLPVTDATVTIIAGVDDIDDLTISGDDGANLAWGWFYTPTLAAGSALVIDTQNYSVTLNGTGVYDSFFLAANHAVDTWFNLPVGDSYIRVNWTGGAADGQIEIVYKDHWN